MQFGDEIRLALLLLLNAAVLAAAWIAARRWAVDPVQRIADALLLWFAIQYAAVCVPGVLHVLSAGTMALAALLLSAGLVWLARRLPGVEPPAAMAVAGDRQARKRDLSSRASWLVSDHAVFLAAGIFVAIIIVGVIYKQEYLPLTDSDAMTYHGPAAVTWLQTGRLGLFPVWFFNPANTFSPLAGSAFFAWLLAPLGNDVLARAVQGPPVLLLFVATLQIGRAIKLPAAVAALAAVATVVSRPFISEIMAARDDVFLAAFIAAAVAACSPGALRDRLGPWRLGLAVGLAMATKYTFLFAAPILLLVIDAPVRAGWKRRHWAAAIATALVIAGPWYLRNLALTGNPLYPVELKLFGVRLLPGLFESLRSERLRTLGGVAGVLIGGRPGQGAFHGPPPWLLWPLLTSWAAALGGPWRDLRRDPVLRACLLGLPMCLALFIAKAPYGEGRFLFPALAMTFVAAGLGIQWAARWPALAVLLAAALAALALLTSFEATSVVIDILQPAFLLTILGVGLVWANRELGGGRRLWAYLATAALLALGLATYVFWPGYLKLTRDAREKIWGAQYPRMGGAWSYVDQNVPADATVAYSNSYHVYPLYGPLLSRRIVHVPVRADVPDFLHLPRPSGPLRGEQIEAAMAKLLCENPDRDMWLRRMLDSGAGYLVVSRGQPVGDPPELGFAAGDATHFTPVFQDKGAVVFRVSR